MSVYAVESEGNRYRVVAINAEGKKFPATQLTPFRDMAENWCIHLRRSAQVEEERKKQIRSGH